MHWYYQNKIAPNGTHAADVEQIMILLANNAVNK